MKAKFGVGDHVVFDQGKVAEKVNAKRFIDATIQSVHTDKKLSRPVYIIRYDNGIGGATVGEEQLSLKAD